MLDTRTSCVDRAAPQGDPRSQLGRAELWCARARPATASAALCWSLPLVPLVRELCCQRDHARAGRPRARPQAPEEGAPVAPVPVLIGHRQGAASSELGRPNRWAMLWKIGRLLATLRPQRVAPSHRRAPGGQQRALRPNVSATATACRPKSAPQMSAAKLEAPSASEFGQALLAERPKPRGFVRLRASSGIQLTALYGYGWLGGT